MNAQPFFAGHVMHSDILPKKEVAGNRNVQETDFHHDIGPVKDVGLHNDAAAEVKWSR